jgi:hypothetical protein
MLKTALYALFGRSRASGTVRDRYCCCEGVVEGRKVAIMLRPGAAVGKSL